MTSRVSFHWLLTLFALLAPAALTHRAPESDAASSQTSDVIFRHYL